MACLPTILPQHRRYRCELRALRSLMSDIAWLNGPRLWYEDRAVWQDQRGLMAPDANDLSHARRCLRRIARSSRVAQRRVGIDAGWLARSHRNLDLAYALAPLSAPDLKALVQPVHRRQPANVRRLAALLAAEALCFNELPASAAAALRDAGASAVPALLNLLADTHVPHAGRTLAAMVLGALKADSAELQALLTGDHTLHNAYAWGYQADLPPDPALIGVLLTEPTGTQLAARCIKALSTTNQLNLPPLLLRELALSGMAPAANIVALAETAAAAAPLIERITRHRELPATTSRPLRALAERLLIQRREMVVVISDLAQRYIRASAEPELLRLLLRFVQAMLELGDISPDVQRAITMALEGGLRLSSQHCARYLTQLLAEHTRIWPPAELAACAGPLERSAWFEQRQAYVLELLNGVTPQRRRKWSRSHRDAAYP